MIICNGNNNNGNLCIHLKFSLCRNPGLALPRIWLNYDPY